MKITCNNVCFESKIKLIDNKAFNQKILPLNPKRHEILYPWTFKDIKKEKICIPKISWIV